MHFSNICMLAFAAASSALQIPSNHILWGEGGPAKATLVRRATSTSSAKSSTISSAISSKASSAVSSGGSSVASSSTIAASSTSSKVADSACTNGPTSRNCWSNGYSVATDFDKKWPTTGKTVTYNLEITNTTCNPDGHGERRCQLFNNVLPGPVIRASWGDIVVINVKNSMKDNATGIHWHGVRQLNSVTMDGASGITECPLAPGDTKTYTFHCTQFGTTWYHSHYSSQYGDGAWGPIVIDGPASSNYDYDLGAYPVNDFYYPTAWQLDQIAFNNAQNGQGPPAADNILVNGTNKNANGGGSYAKTTGLIPGKKYLLRLINTSLDNQIRVSLDGHAFTVVTTDLVPIKPYTAQWVLLAVGQRYEVVITANQTTGNYWFRAEAAADCASANNGHGRAIFSYAGADGSDPTSTAFTAPSTCQDESPLVPWVPNTVDSTAFKQQVGNLQVDLTQEQVTTNGQNIVVWGVNLTAIDVQWDKPTLEYVKTGNSSYPRVANLIEIPNEGTWSYWIIQETPNTVVPIPHPIHLHGHDFYLLGTGSGTFDINSSPAGLQYNNPVRRDTALLPGGGWMAIAFPTDNPGAWLLHCHIAWHISEGLGVQFLESKSTMPLPDATWEQTCSNYQKYASTAFYQKFGSGL